MKRPGTRLRALAARVCSEKTMERLIDPSIADLQAEYTDALRSGNVWRSRWTLVVGYIAFAKVALWCALSGVAQAWANWSLDDHHGLVRVIWRSTVAIICVTILLWLPELPRMRDILDDVGSHASLFRLMIYLLPSVLPLSVPVGLAVGAASGVHSSPSRRLTSAILLVALMMSLASLMTLAWVTPATNQSYREALVGQTLAKGDREMTLTELRRSLAVRDQESARRLLMEFHQRLSFALTPLTFAAFGLVVAIRRRPRVIGAVGAVVLAAFGYYIVMWLARSLSTDAVLPAHLGPWLPHFLLVYAIILMCIFPSGRPKVPSITLRRA
jgi:lipopolysaccharide export LptBFGC system permease protein LptF